jgi:ATP synthase protein I
MTDENLPDIEGTAQESEPDTRESTRERLVGSIGRKERRKLRSRRRQDQNLWFGLGMFGLVGWSVAIPTLIGVAIAVWANSMRPGTWTLGFFFLGLALGCLNAWYWIMKEVRIIERERAENGPQDDKEDAHEQ